MDIFDLLSNDTTNNKTLDDYQTHQVRQLVADLLHQRFAALQSPTGAGKTLVARAVVHSLWDIQDALSAVAVVVPQNQIKDPWCQQVTIHHAKLVTSHANILPVVFDTRGRWTTLQKDTQQVLAAHLNSTDKKVLVTTHSTLASLVQDLPQDCSNRLLIVDEAQHLGPQTRIQKTVQTWVERGGWVLVCSAALIRSKGDVAIPNHILPVVRTLAEHIRQGYAPRHVRLRSKVLDNTLADSLNDLLDLDDSPGFKGSPIEDQASQVVRWWVGKGRPKFIIIVPAGVSKKWAKALIDAFMKAGVEEKHICNGVGTRKSDMDRVIQTLMAEENRLRAGLVSEIHVVIACRRFDEATNWPVASHLGIIGLPSFIGRIIQLLGRILRLKLGIGFRKALPDYEIGTDYHQFGNEAEMTFFLPDNARNAWDAVWASKHHLDLVLMLAALMQDMELGTDYLATIRDRAKDPTRSRNTKDPHLNRDTWDRIASAAGETVEEFQNLYAQVREAAFYLGLNGNKNPTDADLKQFLMNRMGLTTEQADQALFVKSIRHQMSDKLVLSSLDARITQGLLGPQTSPTIILQTMRELFDKCAQQLVIDNSALFIEAKDLRERLSELTIRDPEIVATKLRDALPTEQLTEQEALAAIEDFPGPGRPNTASGLIDGYNKVTWRDLNSQARRFSPPTNLHLLVEKVLGPEGWVGKVKHQESFEKYVRANPTMLDTILNAILNMTAPKISIREVDEHLRAHDPKHVFVNNTRQVFYAKIIPALVPALGTRIKRLTSGYIIDWAALGIDPLDKKWDDYQVKAGGKLPRAMPKVGVPKIVSMPAQLEQVRKVMADEVWRTIPEIATAANAPSVTSVDRQVRWLQDPKYGLVVERRARVGAGVSEYRLISKAPQPTPATRQPTQVAAIDPQFLTDTFNSLASLGLWS